MTNFNLLSSIVKPNKAHIAPFFGWHLKLAVTLLLTFLCSLGAMAQNTKGDRPIPNQRQIREIKFKAVKKPKRRSNTRDISGRRLRTVNKSSASRANAKYRQPDPYFGRKEVGRDKPSEPRGRIFDTPPSKTQRAWKGDISGRKVRVQSRKSQSARSNVFPQSSTYVNTRSPKPKIYTRTASGKKPIKRIPQQKQRAWKGNIQGGPVGTPSRTGQYRKIYPQSGRFVNHSSKSRSPSGRTFPNQSKIARASQQEFGDPPGKRRRLFSRSASRSFVVKKKPSVYWGKFSKGEKPYTRDITGRPLRMRNFRSTPAGLVSRDSVRFFGRKPKGERPYSGRASSGFVTATKEGQRAWKGDISGQPIRRNRTNRKSEVAGKFVFPRKLSISTTGKAGKKLPGAGYYSRTGKTKRNRNPLPARAPGIGANGINYEGRFKRGQMSPGFSEQGAGYQGNLKRGEQSPGFTKQGAGFAGNIKSRRPAKGGGSVSGRLWNNRQSPLPPRTPRGGADIAGFQGRFKRGELSPGFSEQGAGFQGNFKRGELSPGFTKQGAGFAGNLKTRRPAKGGGSVSGKLWNNRQSPLPPRTPKGGADIAGYQGRFKRGELSPGFSQQGAGYQGNFRRGELSPGFTKQGADFAGNIKTRRPAKGGGSISGKLWNNRESPLPPRVPKGGADMAGYQGRFKRGELSPGFSEQGANYQGNFKRGELSPGFTKQGADFAGNIKTKRPQKGGGSVSGKLWNNEGNPIAVRTPKGDAAKAGAFSGNLKAKRPQKGGGSVSGVLWNNEETPIAVRTPSGDAAEAGGFSGNMKSSRFSRNYVQNPNAVNESVKKQKPSKYTFRVAGLQVKVKEGNYKHKPSSADGSLPGVAPTKSSVKAGEYARGVKVYWNYKRNPVSNDEALMGRSPAKAYGKVGNYQGNVKMRKFNDSELHPDAKFAHSYRDNVKEERTILMNFKLMWAKLFKKSDTQPDHLKEKHGRPRYDKGEKGMWYE